MNRRGFFKSTLGVIGGVAATVFAKGKEHPAPKNKTKQETIQFIPFKEPIIDSCVFQDSLFVTTEHGIWVIKNFEGKIAYRELVRYE